MPVWFVPGSTPVLNLNRVGPQRIEVHLTTDTLRKSLPLREDNQQSFRIK